MGEKIMKNKKITITAIVFYLLLDLIFWPIALSRWIYSCFKKEV